MRSNRLIPAVAFVGLAALSTNARALEPERDFSKMLHPTGVIPMPEPLPDLTANQVVCANDAECDNGDVCDGVETCDVESGECLAGMPPCAEGCIEPGGTCIPFNDNCPSVNLGVFAASGGSFSGDTTNLADDFDVRLNGCGDFPGGPDQVFEFQVEVPGGWGFSAFPCAGWSKNLTIWEDDGTCPGTFLTCGRAFCQPYLREFLAANTTYYLVVDGKRASDYGTFEVFVLHVEAACTSNADCDDGLFCTGQETCEPITGECFRSPRPCMTYEGYTAPCDEDLDLCLETEDCFTWIAGAGSGYFFPAANHCPDFASWVLDDVQGSHHTTGVLDFYTTPIIARSTPSGASPLGTTFPVTQALFTVRNGCNPDSILAGSTCTNAATIDPGSSPAHDLPCSGTMPLLPNNSGDFNRCEIDFFMAYRTTENGAGMLIAGQKPLLGGPAAADDFGTGVFWLEDCPPTGAYYPVSSDADYFFPLDFATAVVCQKPGGSCCLPDGSCSLTSEADCAAFGGTFGFTGTINGTDGGCGGDPDFDGVDNLCGDNCPDAANPDQEDCDGDGAGDACDPEGDADGTDGDGVCQNVDNCLAINNPEQVDTDGDGKGDACDPCPLDRLDDQDNDGFCDSDEACDLDPLKQLPGQCGCGFLDDDSDGDGVPDCNDLCPGVDDAVFAPECEGAIPTTSLWGLIVLTLLLLAGGKTYFGGRRISANRRRC